MMKLLVPILVFVIVMPALSYGENPGFDRGLDIRERLTLPQTGLRGGLLDPNRFSMSQSYSIGFFSDGKSGVTTGLYTNYITYNFSSPLTLKVKLGYLHDPSMLFRSSSSSGAAGLFLPEVRLIYNPSENFRVDFIYSVVPAVRRPYYMRY